MNDSFVEILQVGGHANSLGNVDKVIAIVLNDRLLLNKLYECLFEDDAWVRMRAADAIEKICREHPDWLLPYIDKFPEDLATSTQPSIQWHLAQIYKQVELTKKQKYFAISWLKELLSSGQIDWIVAANAMDTLAYFVNDGSLSKSELIPFLEVQQHHKSKSVVRRANKILCSFQEN